VTDQDAGAIIPGGSAPARPGAVTAAGRAAERGRGRPAPGGASGPGGFQSWLTKNTIIATSTSSATTHPPEILTGSPFYRPLALRHCSNTLIRAWSK
jgi:hypothetical protein